MRFLILGFTLLAAPAFAQAPVRIHGSVAALIGDRLSVHAEDGDMDVILPPGVRISAVADRKLSDIKPGDFVASAAMRGRDGKLHSQELRIFPEALRGQGEGHRPMDLPEQSMTNATVDGVAEATGGRSLRVRYPGGEQVLEVAPDVRVVEVLLADRSLLVPGAAVTVRAVRSGTLLTAVAVQAEKDGIKPPP